MGNALLGIGIVAVVVAAAFFVFSSFEPSVTGAIIGEPGAVLDGEIQKVTLSTKDFNYYPSEIAVEADKPVEITLDSSVKGCLRSFTIRELGVVKYSKDPSQKIVFTPTKKGSFAFACSMGMGYGTIVVE